jgi:hypothetical protein
VLAFIGKKTTETKKTIKSNRSLNQGRSAKANKQTTQCKKKWSSEPTLKNEVHPEKPYE